MSRDEDFDRWLRRRIRWPRMNFKDVEKMFDEMFHDMFENMPQDLYKEERLPDGRVVKRMGPFVYGYSMTLDPDGRPIIREFGNIKPSRKPTLSGVRKPSLEIKKEREPLVDIISDNGTIRVIAEVPGVDKNDIKIHCSERMLTISVDGQRGKYYKDIELPVEVDPKISKAKYMNGVLEIVLKKVKTKKPTGESIKIE